ncbi:Rho guanine nucleotide exchange factor 8-like protein [Tanacetum coccineum]
MTSSGKGVSSALALSNTITNLAASVFGKHNKLASIPEEKKRKRMEEVNWLLSMTDNIVEFIPYQQIGKDGSNMENAEKKRQLQASSSKDDGEFYEEENEGKKGYRIFTKGQKQSQNRQNQASE